jgi:hypothetical protein
MKEITLSQIQKMIYVVRGQKVMLDSDLAELYGVETKVLNQSVKRNMKRFPEDFMFRLSVEEYRLLKSQIVTSNTRGGKVKLPFVFTEFGVAMLSGILNSDRAIEVNITIMRIFTTLRGFYFLDKEMFMEIKNFKDSSTKLFRVVFERLEAVEDVLETKLPSRKKKIGLK